jgi:hypothetical protein
MADKLLGTNFAGMNKDKIKRELVKWRKGEIIKK